MNDMLRFPKYLLGKKEYQKMREVIKQSTRTCSHIVRRCTAHLRSLPTAVIVGAMKCGTTSLFNNLTRYDEILGSKKKEVHFFGENYGKGLGWYRSYFPTRMKARGKDVIEATPKYMFIKNAPRQIKSCLPEVKLIILLRDPVNRAISHYHHEARRGDEKRSIYRAMKDGIERARSDNKERMNNKCYIERGHYLNQIKRISKHFKRERVKIVKSERMFNKQPEVTKEIGEFIVEKDLKKLGCKKRNEGSYARENEKVIDLLARYYKKKNKKLYKFIGKDFGWRKS